ncbi:hypothetical protein [Pandoraea apista]|uniref:hypothetical protein n=1 Tax=Pandoraea apista TaxID=93218 RepID=UPI000659FF19|nr:hypothetical protein [Pandoraea apista]ALS68371.2 hypothetical protein AT395_24810 [Pandoraea apista]ALS68433.2 hypothetical protein AT395_25160 [Pandoraea apista]CFB60461.1 hypothetical protein LMG16407_00500 [Pandoraea apista]
MLRIILLAAILSSQGYASAAPGGRAGWHVNQPTRFMVSAVMRKDGSTDVIKPVHGIIAATDEDEAVATFSRTAKQTYPGYTIISTLASPVPLAGFCENNI